MSVLSRVPDLAGYIDSRRGGATPGPIAITVTESRLIIEAVLMASDNAEELSRRMDRRGRRSMPPGVIRRILAGLVGALVHGVICDGEELTAWRLRHGTAPANAKRGEHDRTKKTKPSQPDESHAIDSDEVIRLREQVNAERDAEQSEPALVEKMIG